MKELVPPRLQAAMRRRVIGVALALALYAGLTVGLYHELLGPPVRAEASIRVVRGARPPTRNVAARDGWFYVDGEPFLVKAVGWDPVRPGELPWERKLHPAELEEDLARIHAAGFNTVRTWAPLGPEELKLVERHGLRVLQGIWVPPDGDFASSRFRREELGLVARVVESSRWSPAILGYLVWNEPRARAVARAGLYASRSFLRELVATVRALDPSALVGYASWPGMEALDDDLLDFTAFNIYPHRPHVVMDQLGLLGYTRMLRDTIARGRPLLISEFGISVSPGRPVRTPGRGGATPAEQATGLCDLASTFMAAGAAGTSVFQWSDGWWKNADSPDDALSHDPFDPEEWFGLIEFDGLGDRRGRPRPALAAFSRWQRAVVVEPRDGQLGRVKPVTRSGAKSAPAAQGDAFVPVRIVAAEPIRLRVSVDGHAPVPLLLHADGAFQETYFAAPHDGARHDVELELRDARGELLRREHRLVRAGPPRDVRLELAPHLQEIAPGSSFSVELEVRGRDATSADIAIATFTEDHFNEQRATVQPDAAGRARATFVAPPQETILTIVAFEADPALAPAERAATWAVAEVRRPR